ncbi:MAG: glycerol-3-phosphate 1-O-acyltransferase PlsY [Candidatus Omnitrophica bacterium]|nr:glycerol-3-phosphate 1-O-acyltransferase PlsY [Candidatus Omnitrophota bacterium]MBU2044727.1 glycerol-3-phosphate 1-O-acyltransferase PlsY [Candidatus Omnitrophota bacterium]MBU2266049.1 glycerol-3-phosphate 1-O-acyltransferase PlsY [Candidatus Omnitrophota bacterium]MBU2473496.1 glycerol-3-phosphate 1-O-acyltransferase PlsY [Candidatus Omnitrophota bacterium]
MLKIIPLVVSYILGSIPFGFITVYLVKKKDIRTFGSGNIGATNVTRVLGKNWGIFVFSLDFFKGFIAPLMVSLLVKSPGASLFILAALFTVIGHNWTCFLKFKGGKGVATSIGAICGLGLKFPALFPVLIGAIVIWVLVFFISKMVSLASLISAFSFLIFSFIAYFKSGLSWEFIILSLALFLFIVLRHKKNIKNILGKKELRF